MESNDHNDISSLNQALDRGFVRLLFERIRNYLICATILAIGFIEYKQKPGFFLGMNVGDYSGTPIILLGLGLFLLNTYDTIRVCFRFLQGIIARTIFSAVFVLFAIRLIELAWKFAVS